MSRVILTAAFGLSLAFGAAAAEAPATNVTLNGIDGQVSVNQGDGFAPAVNGMRLKPGDRVMVQNDSDAELTFDDQCKRDVDENKIATIPEKSPCNGGTLAEQGLNPGDEGAIGEAAATGSYGREVAASAIVTALALWWVNEDDDDTVSP